MQYLMNGGLFIATVVFVVGQFVTIGNAGEVSALTAALILGAVAFVRGVAGSSRGLTGVDPASPCDTVEIGE